MSTLRAEEERLSSLWNQMSALARQSLFSAVRFNDGESEVAPPDPLLLDLLEKEIALTAHTKNAGAVFSGIVSTRGARKLVTLQRAWYSALSDRQNVIARRACKEQPDEAEMLEEANVFCMSFAIIAARWFAGITPKASPEFGVLCWPPLTVQAEHIEAATALRSEVKRMGMGHDSVVYIKAERLRVWLKVHPNDVTADNGLVANADYRPWVLLYSSVADNGTLNIDIVRDMFKRRPSPAEALTHVLMTFRGIRWWPSVLAVQEDSLPILAPAAPFLHGKLGIQLIAQSRELSLIFSDDIDEILQHEETHYIKTYAKSNRQWVATPLCQILSTDAARAFYAAAATYWRAAPWSCCKNLKLGILRPGWRWRLGVPLGWSAPGLNAPPPGFAVNEINSSGGIDRIPGLCFKGEGCGVPFADADDAAFFGFELAEGMYPDPILVDTTAFDRDGGRPSADDLEWMAVVMPAVAAFCDTHRDQLRQHDCSVPGSVLLTLLPHKRFVHTHLLPAGGEVIVCWPPPVADQGPHSAVEPIAALLRAAFGHGSDDIIV